MLPEFGGLDMTRETYPSSVIRPPIFRKLGRIQLTFVSSARVCINEILARHALPIQDVIDEALEDSYKPPRFLISKYLNTNNTII
jgi:hypothetical protein